MDLLNLRISRRDATSNTSRYQSVPHFNTAPGSTLQPGGQCLNSPSKVKINYCKVSRIFFFRVIKFIFVSISRVPSLHISDKQSHISVILLVLNAQSTKQGNDCSATHEHKKQNAVVLLLAQNTDLHKCPTRNNSQRIIARHIIEGRFLPFFVTPFCSFNSVRY
jgi:hypothetical protein